MRKLVAASPAPASLATPRQAKPFQGTKDHIVGYDKTKRAIDVLLSISFLFLFFPLFLFVILTLFALHGRPIFIAHPRLGRGGKTFRCLKFRSMVRNPDEILERHLAESSKARIEWVANHKLKADPRVTSIGHLLRKSSVDELPQFINVLRGDMSLVGPRPIVEAEVSKYGTHIQHYYQVRPGLTGRWQVSGRSDVSYTSRVKMDVDYVESRGLFQDLTILFKTVPCIVASRGSY